MVLLVVVVLVAVLVVMLMVVLEAVLVVVVLVVLLVLVVVLVVVLVLVGVVVKAAIGVEGVRVARWWYSAGVLHAGKRDHRSQEQGLNPVGVVPLLIQIRKHKAIPYFYWNVC